ncbi:MAG: gamma-glutamyl-gamma-aminobutyrate hydrolase family protein [Paludibacterium sp.]|uniref:gamma-glutamyl-gamma-aminobutyrate hydrolase family protein n=1 Tax=Paludibacterium sp. TaxID=1917523 RepID=UPI0025E1ABA4|nr:gamma-glutamyl-gamma-aminobutyrate hydrolase family protein [Paludibacterium sp.]MBV8046113.1 gamma-glutamyl-gamma-aminobutyrate hydrolase family protein [Paludibacterium sp.]MBV8648335.1 gamma-glutamyl-gamma-aminobutyrate hydrolase family protein [Paludibacterium sp.]
MKVVAVSQRVDIHPERQERRDALDQALGAWLLAAGFLPAPVPNLADAAVLYAWFEAVRPEAIVLSGGNDIGRCPERDDTEGFLLAQAQLHRLPLLGICRGMQMLAHWLGAELQPVDGHVRARHQLHGEIEGEANSYHAIGLIDCPAHCRVLARSEDNRIEAVAHQTLPWEGWMWHPERESIWSTRDLDRIRLLFGS